MLFTCYGVRILEGLGKLNGAVGARVAASPTSREIRGLYKTDVIPPTHTIRKLAALVGLLTYALVRYSRSIRYRSFLFSPQTRTHSTI